jgi:hypothetical protein
METRLRHETQSRSCSLSMATTIETRTRDLGRHKVWTDGLPEAASGRGPNGLGPCGRPSRNDAWPSTFCDLGDGTTGKYLYSTTYSISPRIDWGFPPLNRLSPKQWGGRNPIYASPLPVNHHEGLVGGPLAHWQGLSD